MKTTALRIEDDLFRKLQIIAKYEYRSVNSQIITLIRKHVHEFEDKHGPIPTQADK